MSEINAALTNANGIMYYNLNGGTTFYDIMTGTPITVTQMSNLPQIQFTDQNGNVSNYSAGNGNLISTSTANVTVAVGTISTFKQVTVNSTDVNGAVQFALKESSAASYLNAVMPIGQTTTVSTSQNTLEVDLLDAGGNVLATGTINVSVGAAATTVQLTTTQQPNNSNLNVIGIS
jgi:hypothetical protein